MTTLLADKAISRSNPLGAVGYASLSGGEPGHCPIPANRMSIAGTQEGSCVRQRRESRRRSPKRPRHHQRELSSPKRVAVGGDALSEFDVGTGARNAWAHRFALLRKNGSNVPATRYTRGSGPDSTPVCSVTKLAPLPP
jgi:hypothetical protein